MTPRAPLLAALVALWLALWPTAARAHPLSFGVLRVRERAGGRVELDYRFSGTETRATGAEPELPAWCTPLAPADDRPLEEGGLERRQRFDCGARGLDGATIAVRGMEGSGVQIVLRVERADGTTAATVLDDRARALALDTPRSALELLRTYAALGVEHIALGVDHLLFVLGLVLLVRRARPLLAVITAFTLGHSATLALATLGLVHVPAPPVEACIALSVLLVALELARADAVPRQPALMAGLFGLLHGLGFAGALGDAGLPRTQVPLALLGFNAGVELGQLVFVALLLALGALTARHAARVRVLAVHAMGGTAAYFLLDRLADLGTRGVG